MSHNLPLLVGDAARIVRKSPETVRLWIRSGRLSAQATPGGVYIIQPDDLAKAADQVKPARSVPTGRGGREAA